VIFAPSHTGIEYPDSDAQPIAGNTLQFQWIVAVQGNLDAIFRDDPNVSVAGDLLWYPVEGNNQLRVAPDAMVVFGRPKGHRGSYMQWREDNIAPQVVFEVLSPGDRPGEMTRKFKFHERYGVDEYYLMDPDNLTLDGWLRRDGLLISIDEISDWVSPALGIRFVWIDDDISLYRSDRSRFLTHPKLDEVTQREKQRADTADTRPAAADARAEKPARRL